MEKVTKAMRFDELVGIVDMATINESEKEALKSFLEHEKELASKKHTSKKETEAKKLSNELAEVITEVLDGSDGMTVGAIVKAIVGRDEKYADVTGQKVTSILTRILCDTVSKKVEKGQSLYFLS